MKKLGTHFLFFVSILFISSSVVAQINGTEKSWKNIYSAQGITIEYNTQACNLPEHGIELEEVYLKFTNTTDKLLLINWEYDVTYGDKCFNCEGGLNEMSQSLKLEPRASMTAECGDDNDFRLRIFSKFLNMENQSVMEDFHVKNIVVKELTK